jgi:hypothetical protein
LYKSHAKLLTSVPWHLVKEEKKELNVLLWHSFHHYSFKTDAIDYYALLFYNQCNSSLENVGVYLPTSLLLYDQLYVAICRVTSREELKILLTDEDSENTNVT